MIQQDTESKYNVKIKDGDKEIDEEVKVDTKKKTETSSISKTVGNAGEVKVVYDFEKVTCNVYRLNDPIALHFSAG